MRPERALPLASLGSNGAAGPALREPRVGHAGRRQQGRGPIDRAPRVPNLRTGGVEATGTDGTAVAPGGDSLGASDASTYVAATSCALWPAPTPWLDTPRRLTGGRRAPATGPPLGPDGIRRLPRAACSHAAVPRRRRAAAPRSFGPLVPAGLADALEPPLRALDGLDCRWPSLVGLRVAGRPLPPRAASPRLADREGHRFPTTAFRIEAEGQGAAGAAQP